ncbi:unnamed protein product [Aspergillus oryzae RIB40]|uniref:DNA, SC038 n=2 Tax=Aspergillus oryzae TaxID=5062 RepID=Q2U375_ASPOR|nr:unnamed protein product [Aspergillus oryzae RIB40]EIT83051.1 hypothetical protein Ao3042_11689 [Aspergillus oryzae 3.042]KDE83405.1 hypothetical protein AO1008_09948 [Aspergillus oryzae 100-8]BAE63990.1 unnamed protein product [Aspergillus oryzae RIB40]|eukprot:EIT83051.1 hypothetical protein Ao3042_11689 [Aspergillus oryzae 3.042]
MNPVMKSETSAAVPQSQTEGYGEFSPFLYIYFCHNRIKVAPDRDSSFQHLLGAADIDNEDQHGSQSAIALRMSALGHFGASTHILYWELGSVLGATLVQKEAFTRE